MWKQTKFVGVRYRESTTRTVRVKGKTRPEKCFYIRYKGGEDRRKSLMEKVGWESEGVDAETARDQRGKIVSNMRLGAGPHSIKEQRQKQRVEREANRLEKENKERENTPFSTLVEKYLSWAKENKKTWIDDKGRYERHVKPLIGKIPINQFSVLIMERMKRDLKCKKINKGKVKTQLAEHSVKHCIVMVRKIFYWAADRGLYEGKNPVKETIKADKQFLKVEDNKRLRFLSFKEAEILLNEIKSVSQQTHDICLVSFQTGMRMGEIFNLQWQDLDLNHGVIHIRNPKNNETRQAYITPPLKAMFQGRKGEKGKKAGLVFANQKGKRIHQLSDTFNRAVDKLKLNEKDTDRQNKIVPHTLRHTFASWLALQGEPLLTIKELMGHKDVETTLRYAHLMPDQKRKAAERLAESSGY